MEEDKLRTEKKFDIKEIYTPLSVAKEEIWRRWNDPVLRKKVEDFLGGGSRKGFLGLNLVYLKFDLLTAEEKDAKVANQTMASVNHGSFKLN